MAIKSFIQSRGFSGITVLPNDFVSDVQKRYQNLHSETSDDFEKSVKLENGLKVTVIGERNDASYWGEDKYTLDGVVRVEISGDLKWEDVNSAVDKVTNRMESVLEDTISYDGPVIVRSNGDKSVREWARRMIHTEVEEG